MNRFTISQLQQFSGINVHTIRAWEKRYNALEPQRSAGNTRYYTGEHLKRLLNIRSLIDYGEKISDIAVLDDSELQIKVRRTLNDSSSILYEMDFIASILNYDESLFNETFRKASSFFSTDELYSSLIYPLLVKTGVMWLSNDLSPAQEHFLTNLIRQKLCTAIETIDHYHVDPEKWVLFLPEGEHHEIGLLYASFILKKAGKTVYYLGANLADNSIRNVCETLNPDYILLFMVHNNDPDQTDNYFNTFSKIYPSEKTCVVSSAHILSSISKHAVIKMNEPAQLINFIR